MDCGLRRSPWLISRDLHMHDHDLDPLSNKLGIEHSVQCAMIVSLVLLAVGLCHPFPLLI